jgi:hypothetical protein
MSKFIHSTEFNLLKLLMQNSMLSKIKELESQIEQREQELKSKQLKLESLNPKLNQILEVFY